MTCKHSKCDSGTELGNWRVTEVLNREEHIHIGREKKAFVWNECWRKCSGEVGNSQGNSGLLKLGYIFLVWAIGYDGKLSFLWPVGMIYTAVKMLESPADRQMAERTTLYFWNVCHACGSYTVFTNRCYLVWKGCKWWTNTVQLFSQTDNWEGRPRQRYLWDTVQ